LLSRQNLYLSHKQKKSRRDVREVAFIAVLAYEGKGDGSSPVTEIAFVVLTLLVLYSSVLLQCVAKSDEIRGLHCKNVFI
jgi:hypothetical protein